MINKQVQVRIFILFLMVTLLFSSCQKEDSNGGICLSFDDNYIEEWEGILPLLDQYGVSVTFFIKGINELSLEERNKLIAIKAAGHDIQAHGELHTSMNTHINSFGLKDYLNKEIKANVVALENLGIQPSVFAYPFGEKNKYIDLFLFPQFKATRNVLPKFLLEQKSDLVLRKLGEKTFWYYSLGIDNREGFTKSEILDLINKAQSENKILFIHAHQIVEGDFAISKEFLEFWIKEAKKGGFKFLTYRDIEG